jgi:hypothetical protein
MTTRSSSIVETLRLQLAAVKQHFIHVLILEARGDKASATLINSIDSVDLPNAMQLVENLVSGSDTFSLCANTDHLLQTMPMAGFTNSEIIVAEQRLENAIIASLQRCLPDPPNETINHLVTKSLEPRAAYAAKLTDWKRQPERSYVNTTPLSDEQSQSIDCLFANMMVVIDQTMTHAFTHRLNGDSESAAAAWEVSGAAMMQATALTNKLAARGLVASPAKAVEIGDPVALPVISKDPAHASAADRGLAEHCTRLCDQCEPVLHNTEFGPVFTKAKAFFESACRWTSGNTLLKIPNPCRDFDRTIEVYVRNKDLDQTA